MIRYWRKRKIVFHIAASCLFIIFFLFQNAQAEKAEIKTGNVMKGVSGEVSAIGKDYIAIVYNRDMKKGTEEEIMLSIAKDIKLEHKRSLSEIGAGDTVEVQFEEVTEQTNEGPRTKRIAKVIRFIRAAVKQPESSVLVGE